MQPERASAARWHARISRAVGKWHRVEDAAAPAFREEPDPTVRAALESLLATGRPVDPRLEACPIALVKEPAHAKAIASLPRLAAALQGAIDGADGWEQEAQDALNEMEGR